MSDESGTTVGFWTPADDDTVAEFDNQFADGPGYSRSASILNALEAATTIDRALERSPYEVRLTDPEAPSLIREAIKNLAAEEFDD
jgi:hypothetical protein